MNYKEIDAKEIQDLWEMFCFENFNEALMNRYISAMAYTISPEKIDISCIDFFKTFDLTPKPIDKDSFIFRFMEIINAIIEIWVKFILAGIVLGPIWYIAYKLSKR